MLSLLLGKHLGVERPDHMETARALSRVAPLFYMPAAGHESPCSPTSLPPLCMVIHFVFVFQNCMLLHTVELQCCVSFCCKVIVAQLSLTLCDSMDHSLPDSSVHGILQARILEWVAIFSSRESSQPREETRSLTSQADSLLSEPPGKPSVYICMFFFIFFSITAYHRILNLVPCALQ